MNREKESIPEDQKEWKEPNKENSTQGEIRAVERFKPTLENPIEKVQVGLYHILGNEQCPTRVLCTLKNGEQVSIPWKEAKDLLPREFAESEELAVRAQGLMEKLWGLDQGIRLGTDFLKRSGEFKSKTLRIVGRDTKPNLFLDKIYPLVDELTNLTNKAYRNLQEMVSVQRVDTLDTEGLSGRLGEIEKEIDELSKSIFKKFPKTKQPYHKFMSEITRGKLEVE